MSDVTFNTGANFAEGAAILSPVIQEIASQAEAQVGLEDEAAKLGFVRGVITTPSGEITSMIGPEPLRKIAEDGEAPLRIIEQGYTKGYAMDTYGLKHKCTKLFLKWIENGAQVEGADSSVKAELNKFKEQIQNLVDGAKLTMNEVLTKVLAEGFASTTTGAAFGPGSKLGDGQYLFSASHPVKKFPSTTFTNIATGALSASTLEATIALYKSQVKTGNGYRVKCPSVFQLLVPRALETTARKILNTPGSQAGIYAGTGTNANLLNVFSFNGSAVELVVLDMLGEVDAYGNKIGGANADAMWFLLNKEYAMKYKTFRFFTLWNPEMTMWKNDETDSVFTKITMHFGADAYNAEAIMGYPGA